MLFNRILWIGNSKGKQASIKNNELWCDGRNMASIALLPLLKVEFSFIFNFHRWLYWTQRNDKSAPCVCVFNITGQLVCAVVVVSCYFKYELHKINDMQFFFVLPLYLSISVVHRIARAQCLMKLFTLISTF